MVAPIPSLTRSLDCRSGGSAGASDHRAVEPSCASGRRELDRPRRCRRFGLLAGALLVGAVVGLSNPPVASAHASLVESSPAAGEVLDDPPTSIDLRFSEGISLIDDAIRVLDDAGTTIALGPVGQPDGAETMTAAVRGALADGSYVVAWRAISDDGHPVSGAYVFSVGAPSGGDASAALAIAAGGEGGSGPGSAGVIGRWLGFAGTAVFFGGLLMLVVCAPGLIAGRAAGRMLWCGWLLAVAGPLVLIAAQVSVAGGRVLSGHGLKLVADTRPGMLWLARLAVTLAVVPMIPLRRRMTASEGFGAGLGLLLIVYLAIVAGAGHAATGYLPALGLAASVVHLGAMSVWVGGLLVVTFVARGAGRWSVAERFSPVALGSLIAVVISGVVNGWRQLDGLAQLGDTGFGRWLLVKVGVVLAIGGAAIVPRVLLGERKTTSKAGGADPATDPSRDRLMRWALRAEVAGMVLVLLATALITGSRPGRAIAARPPAVTVEASAGGRSAVLVVDPPITGGTAMHVTISSPDGVAPDEISAEATAPALGLGPLEIPMIESGPDHATTDTADFPVAGRWTVGVTARYGDFDQVVFTFVVEIAG